MRSDIKKLITLDNIIYWAVCLYVLDVILLGTGELTRVAGISSRIVFFAIAFLLSVPAVIKNYKLYLHNKCIWFVVVFMVMVGISAVRGYINGNDMPILTSDVKGFLNILIVFPMIYILSEKEKAIGLLKLILDSSFIMAIISIVLSYFQFFGMPFKYDLYDVAHDLGWASFTPLTETVTRVFLHSGSRMLVLGLLLAFAFLLLDKDKKMLRYGQMICCLVATFITYARAMYLGLAVVVVAMFVFVAYKYKEYLKETIKKYVIVLVASMVVILVIGLSQHGNLFQVAINRCLLAVGNGYIDPDFPTDGLDNMQDEIDSLVVREYRRNMAVKNFSESPVIGKGLGVVNDMFGLTIEYFYLDILSKMGIVGVVLLLLPAVFALISIVKNKEKFDEAQRLLSMVCWFALLYLMIISYFNPCMNTSWGLAVYGLTIALSIPWKERA